MPRIVRRRRVARKAGKRMVARKAYRKRNYRKRSSNVPEYASLSCKRSMAPGAGGNFLLGVLYNLMNTSLDQFPRAVQVAGAYQHYRIKKIAVTVKTSYDAFQAGAGAVTKPRLYYMIDKSGTIPTNITLEGLKQMGARPRELDESNIVIQWAPSVLEASMDNAPNSIPAKYRISPWLATNNQPLQPGAFIPSAVDHLGLYWYLDALNNPEGYQYQCEVEVQFQFKKPLANATSTVSAVPASLATIDNSSDGIVGGHDGVPQNLISGAST